MKPTLITFASLLLSFIFIASHLSAISALTYPERYAQKKELRLETFKQIAGRGTLAEEVGAVLLLTNEAFELLHHSFLYYRDVSDEDLQNLNMGNTMAAQYAMSVWENTAYVGDMLKTMETATRVATSSNMTRIALLKWAVHFCNETILKQQPDIDDVYSYLEKKYNFDIIEEYSKHIPIPERKTEPEAENEEIAKKLNLPPGMKVTHSSVTVANESNVAPPKEKVEVEELSTRQKKKKLREEEEVRKGHTDFDPEQLHKLSRRELQDIAQRYSVPTNQKKEDLIKALRAKLRNKHKYWKDQALLEGRRIR